MKKAKVTVLVVDDEPRYLWTIRLNLEARGYIVLEAPDGETALDIAVTECPDLVLLDVRMPAWMALKFAALSANFPLCL